MNAQRGKVEAAIENLTVSAYKIPTDSPESDGTYAWRSTTLLVVHASGDGRCGMGYSYADTSTAQLAASLLAPVVQGRDAFDLPGAWAAMVAEIRNLGRPGVCSMAIAAVDSALWDLKARLLDLPLVKLLGAARDAAPIYGSGGFTSYSLDQLTEQLGGWVSEGIPRVKMKVGREPAADLRRVAAARKAIGPEAELFVDANGAYSRKEALKFAEQYAELGVSWFEEPVSSDDLEGLRLLRDRGPAGMEIAAGEYGYDIGYFRRMLEAGAVDVVQADATRCAGISGFMQVASLCQAHGVELSAHCAPALHLHPCLAIGGFRHLEYFHDHARIEQRLFDGAPKPIAGCLRADLSRPGMGLEIKQADAQRYLVWQSGTKQNRESKSSPGRLDRRSFQTARRERPGIKK